MELFATLTINGVATGMLIFLIAVGLSLIFGLMDVLNFSHGALSMWGAYFGLWVYKSLDSKLIVEQPSPWLSLLFFIIGIIAAIAIGAALGFFIERYIIRPVYGNHVQQILITMGIMLILNEMVKLVWGSNIIHAPAPQILDGSKAIAGIDVIKYRIMIILIGLIVLVGLVYLLKKTKIGLIVRAGVSNKEMVQSLGINVKKVFTFVFMLGAGLAALGGMLMAPFMNQVYPSMGTEKQLLAFVVVVIGGMGSVTGSALAGVIVGLTEAYMLYFFPEAALAVNVLLMAIVLLLKPSGLLGERS